MMPEWKVVVEAGDDCVIVKATEDGRVMSAGCDTNGMGCGAFTYVRPPSLIARMVGITYEDKIEWEVERRTRWLERKNNQYYKNVVKKYKAIHGEGKQCQ